MLRWLALAARHYRGKPYDAAINYLEIESPEFLKNHIRAGKYLQWYHTDVANLDHPEDTDRLIADFAKMDAVICVAESAKESFVGRYPQLADKTHVIYNFFDEKAIRRMGDEPFSYWDDRFVMLSVGRMSVYSLFMMLGGMLLPFAFGVLFLRETVSVGKTLGSILLTASIVLQALDGGKGEKVADGQRLRFFLLCMAAFMINGMTGVVARLHQLLPGAVDECSFTVLVCLFCVMLGLAATGRQMLGNHRPQSLRQLRGALQPRALLYGLLVGAAMHTGNYLILAGANHVPASVQFPVISGGTIVLSALLGRWILKQKTTPMERIAIVGALIAMVAFAF